MNEKLIETLNEKITTLPVLYSFRRCPYAMRARLALKASGRACELREIVLRDKPPQMLDASLKGTVPVLILGADEVIDQSLDIMLWTLRQNDPEHWLEPEHGSLDEMLDLISDIDGDFKHHLDRYKYATRYEGADPEVHRADALACLSPLISRLARELFLFGDRPALADMALFPFVRQFANTDPAWFSENAPPALQAWLTGQVTSKLFQSIFIKWAVWDYQSGEPGVLFANEA